MGFSSRRAPSTRRYFQGPPDEETRQQYANERIREFQRTFPGQDFACLLGAFRSYGDLYDRGYRLREGLEGAA